MKRIMAVSLLVLVTLLAAVQAEAQPANCCVEDTLAQGNCQCSPCECCEAIRPAFYVRTEGVFLRRDVRGATPLASEGPHRDQIVLSTTDFEQPFRGGPKVLIGYTFGESPYSVEASFFSVNEWRDAISITDPTMNIGFLPGNLSPPFTNFGHPQRSGFDWNHLVAAREISDLDSEEINLRHLLPMPTRCLTVSWLVGARHIGVHEQFDYYSHSFMPFPSGSSVAVRTNTGNKMWGPQIGGLFEFYAQHCCWVNFEIKGALLSNSAYQETNGQLDVDGTPPEVRWRGEKNTTAFAADFDLTLVYHPARWLTARFGYQAFWIDGLALASENFNIPVEKLLYGPPDLRLEGTVLYHGPHAGVELHW